MYWQLAGGDKLSPYGEWSYIDSICKNYNYKHDEVFNLSWTEVMTMISYNRRLGYVEARSADIKRQAEKKS